MRSMPTKSALVSSLWKRHIPFAIRSLPNGATELDDGGGGGGSSSSSSSSSSRSLTADASFTDSVIS
jgi:hypothetical protein